MAEDCIAPGLTGEGRCIEPADGDTLLCTEHRGGYDIGLKPNLIQVGDVIVREPETGHELLHTVTAKWAPGERHDRFYVLDVEPERDSGKPLYAAPDQSWRVRRPIRTWDHSRKGRVRGIVLNATGDFTRIILVGDHDPKRLYRSVTSVIDSASYEGEILAARTSFLREVHP